MPKMKGPDGVEKEISPEEFQEMMRSGDAQVIGIQQIVTDQKTGKVVNKYNIPRNPDGSFDVFGGGLVSDVMKYSRLDDAQQQLAGVASALRRYRTELEDVARTVEFNMKHDDFTQTMDIWFDNIFTDLAVLDRIRQSRDQLLHLESRVRGIQEGLTWDLEKVETELNALRTERDELVRKA